MGEVFVVDQDTLYITQLQVYMQVLLVLVVFVPWVIITSFLWWVGSRWLVATNSFADLIMNSIALEFIVMFKDMLYASLMPVRSKLDLKSTKIKLPQRDSSEKMNLFEMNRTLILFFVTAVIVLGYMGIPQ